MPKLSDWGEQQTAPPLRKFASVPEGVVKMANGFPHPDLFCASSLTLQTKDGAQVTLSEEDLGVAQQYAPSAGHEPLRRWCENLTESFCIPKGDVRSAMTCGNFDGLSKSLDVLLQPEVDALFVDEYSFPYSMNILQPWAKARNVLLVPVALDEHGVDHVAFREAIRDTRRRGRIPKALLTIPTGQNPTSLNMTRRSMEATYAVVERENLFLIEDDPYYYTYFGPETQRPSYLSMDESGRVLRLDSFSKWLAPGWRMGWVTGSPKVLAKITPVLAFPSTISQVLAFKLFTTWGEDGLHAHFERVRQFYKHKRDVLHASLRRHLDPDVAVYSPPTSGMFFWIEIVGGPWVNSMRSEASTDEFIKSAQEFGVTCVPVSLFCSQTPKGAAVRVTFVGLEDDELEVGARRLSLLLSGRAP